METEYRKPKYPNMTVKKRLQISHFLMILIPLLCSLAAVIVSVILMAVWTERVQSISAMTGEDALETCRELSEVISKSILGSETEGVDAMKGLESRLDQERIRVEITKGSQTVYAYGEEKYSDEALNEAASKLGEAAYLSSGNRQLYIETCSGTSGTYRIGIYTDKVQRPYRSFVRWAILAGVVFLIAIIVSVILTNKFLTQFVFYRIQGPLDILSKGVEQIDSGNLDYRISYEANDEFRPVTEKFNHMAARLTKTTQELRNQERSRKSLLASISHDLRSPLTAINGYAAGLLDDITKTPEAQEHYIRQISTKSSEMIRMVTRIFMFSKLDMNEYPIYPEKLDLYDETEELLTALLPEEDPSGLRITLGEKIESPVYADPEQLHNVIMNIIENSRKYMDHPEGNLVLTVTEEPDYFVLSMTDDGPGVPESSLPKLFDVFYRSDPARKNTHKSSGLGLAIVKKTVERMNGFVGAENADPRGLRIRIHLPKGGL